MCGIVGLFLKDPRLEPELGRLTAPCFPRCAIAGRTAPVSRSTAARPPASPRFARSRATVQPIGIRSRSRLAKALGASVTVDEIEDHAIFKTAAEGGAARKWLIDNVPEATVLSQGHSIEIFKGVGDPNKVATRLDLAGRSGTHAIGHTRMATESAVTIAGSHPFSTGDDTCLVHNGSLSNHNRLREDLVRHGERFQTDNDTEVAAAYLTWRMREGDNLKQALETLAARPRRLLHLRRRHARRLRGAARSDRLQARRHGRDRRLGRLRHRSIARSRRCRASRRPGSGSRSRQPSTPGAGAPEMTTRKMATAKAGASKPGALPARNSTLDLARMSLREVNQLLHDADGGDFLIQQSARGARPRCRARRQPQRHDRRPCRLLLRRHEQACARSRSTATPAPASPRT